MIVNAKTNHLFISLFLLLSLASCSLSYPSDSSRSKNKSPAVGTAAAIPDNTDPDNIERFYEVHGRRYAVLKSSTGYSESGLASWYGDPFHGRKTANGEVYDMHQMSAAHKHLPLSSYVKVTNTLNGKSVVLRINDRGPFVGDRVIDLSYAAAKALDVIANGTAPVTVRALDNENSVAGDDYIASEERPAFIQIASFTDRTNAQAYHQRLINQGIRKTLVHQIQVEDKGVVFRVQIGPLSSGAEYDNSMQQLREIGINSTILVRP